MPNYASITHLILFMNSMDRKFSFLRITKSIFWTFPHIYSLFRWFAYFLQVHWKFRVLLFHFRFFVSFIFKVFKVRQITMKCIHSSHRMDKRKWFQWANSINLSWYMLVQFRKMLTLLDKKKVTENEYQRRWRSFKHLTSKYSAHVLKLDLW